MKFYFPYYYIRINSSSMIGPIFIDYVDRVKDLVRKNEKVVPFEMTIHHCTSDQDRVYIPSYIPEEFQY